MMRRMLHLECTCSCERQTPAGPIAINMARQHGGNLVLALCVIMSHDHHHMMIHANWIVGHGPCGKEILMDMPQLK